MKNQIYPCLWFEGQANEAARFYTTVFKDAKIISDNSIVSVFGSAGQKFICLNGGPAFTPNPAISFFVTCKTREEVEHAWRTLIEGGKSLMPLDQYPWSEKYGWVQDKYGFSWQLSLGNVAEIGQKFSPTLMFTGEQHGKAEEAIHTYTSIFENSSITGIMRYGGNDGDEEGTIKHAQFKLGEQTFMAMDSSLAHGFSFNQAVSLVVDCQTQAEIDYYWRKLTEGGAEGKCGWLKDRYGISWQIVPDILESLMSDQERAPRVMQAFMQMKKFDIEKLVSA